MNNLKKIQSRTLSKLEEEIAALYTQSAKEISNEIIVLYAKLIELHPDEILISDLYNYNRYNKLLKQINNELTDLGKAEIKVINHDFKEFAVDYSKALIKEYDLSGTLDTKAAKAVIDRVWCADGKNYSDRIWTNKAKLMQTLEQGLFNCVATGASSDKLSADIANIFNVNFNSARRLVRTEINYIQTQLALDRYKASNIKQYKYLSMRDDKVCASCKAVDQNIFDIDKAKIGVNAPPLHPNCRCTIAPVVRGN